MHAIATADLQSLMSVLAPDVVLITDGGGVRKAALRPIHGAEKVLRFVAGVTAGLGEIDAQQVLVNGQPAIQVSIGGEVDTILTARLDDGIVTALYLVRNPAKLGAIGRETPLSR